MACHLLILFSRDSDKFAESLKKHFYHVSSSLICVDDLTSSHMQSCFRSSGKFLLQIVFFSPDFLKFLEYRPEIAYGIFQPLDPLSTMAVFCCGLMENQIMCYHMAPLKSYNSWPKFEIIAEQSVSKNYSVLPETLLRMLKEIIPVHVEIEFDVIIVPQFINKAKNTVYIIFQNTLPNMPSISVHLEGNINLDLWPEMVNPYVLKFIVPNAVQSYRQSITAVVRDGQRILVEKTLCILEDNIESALSSSEKRPHPECLCSLTSKKDLSLNEQLNTLVNKADRTPIAVNKNKATNAKDGTRPHLTRSRPVVQPENSRISDDYIDMTGIGNDAGNSDEEEDLTPSPPELGKNHNPELNLFFNNSSNYPATFHIEDEQDSKNFEVNGNETEDTSNTQKEQQIEKASTKDYLLVSENDALGQRVRRPRSLPSVLTPEENFPATYGEYMDMTRGSGGELPPHKRLLISQEVMERNEEILSSLASNLYVSMTLPDNCSERLNLLKRGLSKSQQELLELMHQFKCGDRTISDVEEQFQDWYKRHNADGKCDDFCYNGTPRKTWKTPGLYLRDWKSLIKGKGWWKGSKPTESDDGRSGKNYDDESSAKNISSASSTSTRTSEASVSTLQSQGNGKDQQDVKTTTTGWAPFYVLAHNQPCCPLSPETQPPPLPTRPPPGHVTKPMPILTLHIPETCPILQPVTDGYDEKDQQLENSILAQSPEDENRLDTLMDFCERYGLEDLGEHFLSEVLFALNGTETTLKYDATKDEVLSNKEDEEPVCSTLTTSILGNDDRPNLSLFRRSLSLPSTLCSSNRYCVINEYEDLILRSNAEDEEFFDSLSKSRRSFGSENVISNSGSNKLYIVPEMPNWSSSAADEAEELSQKFRKHFLSRSQQELLELIEEFKSGRKTMSEVEQQFKEWRAHSTSGSSKDLEAKNEKGYSFGLSGFKIFRRPKRKVQKDKVLHHENRKFRFSKRSSKDKSKDVKRLSKVSFTSTSSGNSESGEVFKHGFFPREYSRDYEMTTPTSSSSSKSPIPFIVKKVPPPLPNSLMASGCYYLAQDPMEELTKRLSIKTSTKPTPPPKPKTRPKANSNAVSETKCEFIVGSDEDTREGVSLKDLKRGEVGYKPIPPPKPTNLSKPNSRSCDEPELEDNTHGGCADAEEEGGSEPRPVSPIYVTPDEPHTTPGRAKRKLKTQQNSKNNDGKPIGSSVAKMVAAQVSPNSISSKSASNTSTDSTENTKRQSKHIAKLARLWKTKKKDEPMFYVHPRRWSSLPDVSAQHLYVELLDLKECRVYNK